MKRSLASLVSALVIATPALAFAETPDVASRIQYLLGQIAALTMQITHAPVTCAVAADKAQVRLGEHYHLVWSSAGAQEPSGADLTSHFAPAGMTEFVAAATGTMKYTLSFRSKTGEETTCAASIRIVSQ